MAYDIALPWYANGLSCNFLSIGSRSFVQRRILYVGFLDLNRGFQHFCDAGDDIGRHEGSDTHPCNNCTWNTHMPWIHCNRLNMCIPRHQRQVCNTWFPTHAVALRKRLLRTAAIFHCYSCCTCQTACQAEWKYGYLLGKHMMSACVETIIWLLFFSHCGKNFDEPRRREKSHWQ